MVIFFSRYTRVSGHCRKLNSLLKIGVAGLVFPQENFENELSPDFAEKKKQYFFHWRTLVLWKGFTCSTPNKLKIYWRPPMKNIFFCPSQEEISFQELIAGKRVPLHHLLLQISVPNFIPLNVYF